MMQPSVQPHFNWREVVFTGLGSSGKTVLYHALKTGAVPIATRPTIGTDQHSLKDEIEKRALNLVDLANDARQVFFMHLAEDRITLTILTFNATHPVLEWMETFEGNFKFASSKERWNPGLCKFIIVLTHADRLRDYGGTEKRINTIRAVCQKAVNLGASAIVETGIKNINGVPAVVNLENLRQLIWSILYLPPAEEARLFQNRRGGIVVPPHQQGRWNIFQRSSDAQAQQQAYNQAIEKLKQDVLRSQPPLSPTFAYYPFRGARQEYPRDLPIPPIAAPPVTEGSVAVAPSQVPARVPTPPPQISSPPPQPVVPSLLVPPAVAPSAAAMPVPAVPFHSPARVPTPPPQISSPPPVESSVLEPPASAVSDLSREQIRALRLRALGQLPASAISAIATPAASAAMPAFEEIPKELQCVVCMGERKTHMFIACNHLCVCESCCEKIIKGPIADKKCPICRAIPQSSMKVFL